MSEVVIYLTRHGKTMLNHLERIQGWSDSPLTAEGAEVARQLGRGLRDTPFAAVYTSDRGRTVETANLVLEESGQTALPITQLYDLREYGFGKYESDFNLNVLELVAKENDFATLEELHAAENTVDCHYIIDTVARLDETGMAEDRLTFQTRIKRGLVTICEEVLAQGGGNVLAIAHGMVIHNLLLLLDSTKATHGIDNASVSKIIYRDGTFFVESVNDTSYIEAGSKITV